VRCLTQSEQVIVEQVADALDRHVCRRKGADRFRVVGIASLSREYRRDPLAQNRLTAARSRSLSSTST
jgi:hypothetical protein